MKNTIKKAICTALAAVSLSALVAVPSALNNPASESSLVHVMEAEAAEVRCFEYTFYTAQKDGNVRKEASLNATIYPVRFQKGDIFVGYKKDGYFINVSPKNLSHPNDEWIYNKKGHLKETAFNFYITKNKQELHTSPYNRRNNIVRDKNGDPLTYNKGVICISRITLEKTNKGYNVWGYFTANNQGRYIMLKKAEDMNFIVKPYYCPEVIEMAVISIKNAAPAFYPNMKN